MAACLWALGTAATGAVVGVAALVTVAGNAPTWYPLTVLATGTVGLSGTIGGLWLAGVAWLRWKLLAVGTAAIIAAGLLTVAVLAGKA